MVGRFGLILFCSLSVGFAAGKKPVTLQDLGSQRMPSMGGSPNWAPDGKRFVYAEAGKLWLYDVPSRSKKQLVSTSAFNDAATKGPTAERFDFENRRVREQLVQWSPSGQELLVSAGGDLFLFRIGVSGWTQLTSTPQPERDAKLSPDGSMLSFRRGHDLYVMNLASRKETRLTTDGSDTILNGELDWVYPEELDLGTAHWWSPDSKSIAYLQFDVSREPFYPQTDLARTRALLEPERYPRAGDPNADVRLGVAPAAGGATRWMDLGEPRDSLRARFYWLPDSQGIMVERLNRIQNELDVVIANAKTGDSRVILHEADKDWVNIQGDPVFLKSGKEFLWESERDGFNHIYRYSIDGKLLGRLTQGDWEVSSVAVDEAGGQVYFVSSEAGPLERQFYRMSLAGGARTRLSKGAGTHSVNVSPTCEYYLDSYSNLTTPTRRTLHTKDGAEWAVYREADRKQLEEYDILPSEIVEVRASDGTLLYARMIKPAGFDPAKKYPVIVNVYGGPHAQSVRNSWPGGVSIDQVLAHRGYIVWALDNRGTSGRGHRFEAAVSRNLGGKEVDDQKDGIRHLVSLGFADPKRVGIQGWSYGGYMTIRSMLMAPDVFACGIAGAPVTDWRNYDTIYTERYMGLPSQNVEGYNRSSNLLAADKLKGKLLIAHNVEDDNVLFQNTVQMVDALQRANKQFELMVYMNKSHGLVRGRNHFNELTASFFDRCLK